MKDDYQSAASRRLQRGESQPVNGGKVANEHQYLYVLGNPGAGKSTFLRRVGLEAIKGEAGNYDHDCIPVMIELKQFNKGAIDLVEAIANELAYFNFPDRIQAAKDYLKQGKLLLLFDGLDEAPKAYADEVQNSIVELKTKYSDNRFILSCRTAAYNSNLTGFTMVELADFDREQIERFINNWFSSAADKQHDLAGACWAKLTQPKYKASLELAQTPLLLTFLCITYGTYEDFPAQRNQLYADALDILLRKWDAQKRGIKRDNIKDIYANWNINLELALLAELAHDFFAADELFFTKDRILEYIQVFLSDTSGDAKYIATDKVLEAIVIQQGILVERAKDIYSFSHLTLQEYLTAKYISQDNRRIEKLVTEHLTDERWREVFLLVAGIKDNSDELLLSMERETYQLINTPKLRNLLAWVEKVTDPTDGDFKYLGKRAIAHAHANALANAHANALACANAHANAHAHALACANANAIEDFLRYARWSKQWQIYSQIDYDAIITDLENLKLQIPNDNQSLEVKQKFTQKLIGTWLSYFCTSQAEINLSKPEIDTLDRYLYSNWLIIQTNEAASRVTQPTWSGIESRMLLPFEEAEE